MFTVKIIILAKRSKPPPVHSIFLVLGRFVGIQIYATSWDNIVEIDRMNEKKLNQDMLFCGETDGDPIHY